VKHRSPPARLAASSVVLLVIALVLLGSACATAPRVSQQTLQYQSDENPAVAGPAININLASNEELETLPGIGKAIAERIIAHRERYGPFHRAEHLLIVRGISDRKFRALRPMIVVE
jgi:competence ComEA-like helix-hairpin-helix protein